MSFSPVSFPTFKRPLLTPPDLCPASFPSSAVAACEGTQFAASCPSGQLVNQITYVLYGRSDTSTCVHSAMSNTGCAASSSTILSIVQNACLNKASCAIDVNNANMGGDPCGGTYKYLKVTYTCALPPMPPPSPFTDVAGYTTLVNQDSVGNDISFNSVSSPGQCASICNSNAACVGFDYIASGPSAPSQPLCIPKYAIRSTLQPFGNGNVGALYRKQLPATTATAIACEGNQFAASCPGGQTITQITSVLYGRSDTSTCVHSAMSNTGCAASSSTILSIVQNACLNKASCAFTVTNDSMGGDPCGGTYKYLKVTYVCA